jgi:Peptidase family M48
VKVLVVRAYRRIQPRHVEETGLLLSPADAPRLHASLFRISELVATPPPDEIRIVPQSSVSVHERTEHAGTVRVLQIGAAALNDLDQQSFLAVLAHEMGHLRSGDTSAGWAALRVTEGMQHLAANLPNGLYSVVILKLLRPTWWLHLRVTLAATRFQEVMADRVAVRAYGAAAFERGLTQVIRNDLLIRESAAKVVETTRNLGTRNSFYDFNELADEETASIEQKLAAALSRPTSMFDSHPSPDERFRLARLLQAVPTESAQGTAWDLFSSPQWIRARWTTCCVGSTAFPSGRRCGSERRTHSGARCRRVYRRDRVHQRPDHFHAPSGRTGSAATRTWCGQSSSRAAKIAANSSSVGAGETGTDGTIRTP